MRTAHRGDHRWLAKFYLTKRGDEDSNLYARATAHGASPKGAFENLLKDLGGFIPEAEEELTS